jgi:hypothetical protein
VAGTLQEGEPSGVVCYYSFMPHTCHDEVRGTFHPEHTEVISGVGSLGSSGEGKWPPAALKICFIKCVFLTWQHAQACPHTQVAVLWAPHDRAATCRGVLAGWMRPPFTRVGSVESLQAGTPARAVLGAAFKYLLAVALVLGIVVWAALRLLLQAL